MNGRLDNLFSNVGAKIQKMARILFVLCLVVGALYFLISLVLYFKNADDLHFATLYGGTSAHSYLEEAGNAAYFGKMGIGNSIALMISSIFTLPLYGLGILVESAEEALCIRKDLKQSNTPS